VTGVVSAETKPGGGRQVMIVAGEASGRVHFLRLEGLPSS
jgi:hypothetical protein